MAVRYDPVAQLQVESVDVEYRRVNGQPMLATVHRPNGPGPFPAILHVHGGQWSGALGGRNRGDAAVVQALAESGMVVAAIDLRTTPGHHYPASPRDVNYGVRWLKAHAREFGADPATVGAFGGSSGGHLVLLHAMRHADPLYLEPDPALSDDATVHYLVCRAPISDPLARYEWARAKGRRNIEDNTRAFFQPWDTILDANPQRILERREAQSLPPLFVIQGGADDNISTEIQEHFVETYRAARGDAEFVLLPGLRHQFFNDPGPDTARALGLVKQFIAKQLSVLQPA